MQANREAGAPERPAGGPWLTPPVGTRDLLPDEAAERRRLARTVLSTFESHGFSLVSTPPFERIEVLDRAGMLDAREVLQFVDVDTGDVAMFRPDITPQIARLVATRLHDRPAPYRLAYEGHVLRRPRGRARRQRQIPQAGVELIGVPGIEADVEVLEVAVRAVEAVGLTAFVAELALVPFVRRLIQAAPPEAHDDLMQGLARKDLPALRAVARRIGGGKGLVELAQLYGGPEVLSAARRALADEEALAPLVALVKAAERRGLGARLRVDLGEVRGFGYYTGPSFALLAEGPGEPIGGGGRYDDLLARFGRPMPGAGFALDLDHLGWASRQSGGASTRSGPDVVVLGGARSEPIARRLRASGLRVVELGLSGVDALAWARAWSVPWILEAGSFGLRATDVATGSVNRAGRGASVDPVELMHSQGQKERSR